MRVARICLLLAMALSAGGRCWSAPAAAQNHFSEGSAAYDAGDFSKARALFEMALTEGMDGPAIHYNIGSAAYRGGDLPRAERAFREVARTPAMASLAYYNLGLVALERRDESAAREWFERAVHDATPDARLKALAMEQLELLPEAHGPGGWYYYTRAGVGYDDNVALRSASIDSSATGESDAYGELFVASTYSLARWRFDAGASLLQYQDLRDFNQGSYFIGAARGFTTDRWYFELGAVGAQASLGGDVYERTVALGGHAFHTFRGGSQLRVQLRGTSVHGQGLFTGLTGARTELGVYLDKHWQRWDLGGHARAEDEDSNDPIFATRWMQLGADGAYWLSPLWRITASAALRRTSHAAQPEIPAGFDDDRTTLIVGITRTLWKRTQLLVSYAAERSKSAVAGYDYDRHWIAATVENWR